LDNWIQLFNGGALIVRRHFRIRDDLDEKDVRDLERDLFFTSVGISVVQQGLASGMISNQRPIVESKARMIEIM